MTRRSAPLGWRIGADTDVPPTFVFENPIVQCPDWCCVVLSASTAKTDRELKLPLYAEAGVQFVWLVDPEAHRAEVFEARGGQCQLVQVVEGSTVTTIRPFASQIDASRWWVTRPEG